MTRIAAIVYKYLAAFVRYALGKNGSYDKSEDVFRKYITLSVLIHIVLIIAFSISYRRAIKPAEPVGPYEVSLIDLEEPKPKVTPPKQEIKQPEPKKPEPEKPKPEEKKPEQKKVEEPVKIKPVVKPKKEEPKPPEEKKPEPEAQKPVTKKPPEQTQPKPPSPDSLLAKVRNAAATPSVSGIQLDSPNFNFNYYLSMLQMKIQNNWTVPKGLPVSEGGIVATVKFTIRTDGTITGVDVEKSSGIRFFDQSALRAVLNSNPAPPLPRAYNDDRLGVHVNFVFKEETR